MTILSRWRMTPLKLYYCRFYATGKIKVLFFGTDNFSLPTLKALNQEMCAGGAISRLETCCSEMKTLIPPVKKLSEELSIKVAAWPPSPSFCAEFDLGIVASFGHLIPSKIIQAFPLGMLNVHGSMLPRWRGAAPIVHAILNGDKSTGVSIMEIQPFHFDLGKVLAAKECSIGPHETRLEVSDKLSILGAELMLDVVRNLPHYHAHSQEQPSHGVTYAPKISKSMFEIQWQQNTSIQVYNQYRALADMSKLHSIWEQTREKVRFDNIIPPEMIDSYDLDRLYPGCLPGQVVSLKVNKGCERLVCIRCAEGWISFRSFYYGHRKEMTPSDFYSGFIGPRKSDNLFSFVTSAHLNKLS